MPLLGMDESTRTNLAKISTRWQPSKDVVCSSLESPNAILVVSAHWEGDDAVRVTSSSNPSLLYDYYGFPKESYAFKYPAPGSPPLAQRVQNLLIDGGIKCHLDDERGFDHGVFVPLIASFPKAEIPVVALSLHSSLDPAIHIRIGQALQPLRKEGVLILGSGMSFHNMNKFQKSNKNDGKAAGEDFLDALIKVATDSNTVRRNESFTRWTTLPGARNAHPREEHLLPLLVCVGAAGDDIGRQVDKGVTMGAAISSFSFP